MTTKNEKAVREAAANLKTAIDEATAAGLIITWPRNVARLGSIAISAGKNAVVGPVTTPAEVKGGHVKTEQPASAEAAEKGK